MPMSCSLFFFFVLKICVRVVSSLSLVQKDIFYHKNPQMYTFLSFFLSLLISHVSNIPVHKVGSQKC